MDDDEFEFDEISAQGNLARISGFSADGSMMFLRMRHGAWAWASSEDHHFDGDVGDVVLVAGNSYRVVPQELWKEDTFIGVVRLKQHDVTVLDMGNRLDSFPTNEAVEYVVDNTVEANESQV